ncbi:MAG: hypothetical protein QOI66_335 [Myxococcales bacterium]|jgi:hypothetical protein|nr:hypothetical protein [Myxococcales bacterium]
MERTHPHSGEEPAAEKPRQVLSLLPRRNLRRALFLLLALLAVLAIKHAGGNFGHLFDAFGPTGGAAAPTPSGNDRSYHLRVTPPP